MQDMLIRMPGGMVEFVPKTQMDGVRCKLFGHGGCSGILAAGLSFLFGKSYGSHQGGQPGEAIPTCRVGSSSWKACKKRLRGCNGSQWSLACPTPLGEMPASPT